MGFFADLIGGAAMTGQTVLQDHINQQRKLEEEQRQQQMYIERQKAIDEQRMALEERKRQEQQARTGEQMLKVDQTAPAVTTARQLAEGQGRAPSLDATALEIVKQHLSPEELKSAYGINDNVFTRIDDKLTAAYQGGMYDAAEVLSKQRDRTIETLRAMRQDAVAESTIAANMALAKQRGAKADAVPDETEAKLINAGAADKRASRPAGTGKGSASNADAIFKTITDADGKVYGVTRSGSKVDLGLTSDALNRTVANYITRKASEDPKFGRLPPAEQRRLAKEVITGVADAPAAAAPNATQRAPAPTGMTAIGKTPDGRIVYRTVDGKTVVGK